MDKKIFLLNDQVIHWNIVPGINKKNVYMEVWGNQSITRLINLLKTYFDEKDNPFNWSLLDNGMGIKETENLNPANAALNHVFATWKPYPEGKEKVWRIDEIAHVGQSADVETVLPQLDGLEQADLLIVQDWE